MLLEDGNPVKPTVYAFEVPELLRDISPDELQSLERKLVRKIDIRLLPMLILMYILNYLDRNNIAAARLAGKVGLQKSLGLSSQQYNVGDLFSCSFSWVVSWDRHVRREIASDSVRKSFVV